MAEVVLYHHIQGLTEGVRSFAAELRRAGHTVHTPDLFDGRTFATMDEAFAVVQEAGDALDAKADGAVHALPERLVYAGISWGVGAAQRLAQTRAGARGALLYEACFPITRRVRLWPMAQRPSCSDPRQGGRRVLRTRGRHRRCPRTGRHRSAPTRPNCCVYPGDEHLFVDSSLSLLRRRRRGAGGAAHPALPLRVVTVMTSPLFLRAPRGRVASRPWKRLLAWFSHNERPLPWRQRATRTRSSVRRSWPNRRRSTGSCRAGARLDGALAHVDALAAASPRRRHPRVAGARVQPARAEPPPGRAAGRGVRLAGRSHRAARRRAYTADAVGCFAHGRDVLPVDVNIGPGARAHRCPFARASAQALIDLGATVCLARVPRCEACPLAVGCPSRGRRYEPGASKGRWRGRSASGARIALRLRSPDGPRVDDGAEAVDVARSGRTGPPRRRAGSPAVARGARPSSSPRRRR